MASIALHQTRTLFPALRPSWGRPGFAAVLLPTFLPSQKPFSWVMPSLQSLLDLFPPFLLAVPKKKVSHSRKAMRSALKGLKDKKNIVNCPACGQPKLAHHLCARCYSSMKHKWKSYPFPKDRSGPPEVEMELEREVPMLQMDAPEPQPQPIAAPRITRGFFFRQD